MNGESNKDNNIEDVVDTTPLSDFRRTRTKSTGRPPSQHFRKESVLQRCISLECDDLSPEEQENSTKVKQITTEESKLIINGVTEALLKKKVDEESFIDGKINLDRRTSLTTPIILPKRVIKEEIPWMNEFRKKRNHKRSLAEEEKKSIEEFIKNDEIDRKITATTFESRKIMSYPKSEQDKDITKNEDAIKSEILVNINKKSEDIKTTEQNSVGRSKIVTNETNFTKHTTSSITEMHQFATTTTSESTSSIQNIVKKINIELPSKKPIELPNVNLKETDSNKIETSNADIIITNSAKMSPPRLPMLIPNLTNEIENKIEEKKSSKIQNQELITKIKTFEETCNKQLKSIRNEVKVLHRELASLSEFVSEFVKTVEHDIASINKDN